jgi:hypothetical protein
MSLLISQYFIVDGGKKKSKLKNEFIFGKKINRFVNVEIDPRPRYSSQQRVNLSGGVP